MPASPKQTGEKLSFSLSNTESLKDNNKKMIDLMRGLVMTNTVTVDDMKTLEGLVLAEMTCNLQKLSDVLQAASKMTGCEDVPIDLSKGDFVSPLGALKGVYILRTRRTTYD